MVGYMAIHNIQAVECVVWLGTWLYTIYRQLSVWYGWVHGYTQYTGFSVTDISKLWTPSRFHTARICLASHLL